MKKMRIFCADSPYGKENCPYAKVIKEEGKFPVIVESTFSDFDGKIIEHKKEERIENYRYAVYCTYYSKQNKKFIGTVEPYGGICDVPEDCPEKISEMKTKTIWQRIKLFFN